jgi:hypothetical protein
MSCTGEEFGKTRGGLLGEGEPDAIPLFARQHGSQSSESASTLPRNFSLPGSRRNASTKGGHGVAQLALTLVDAAER